MRPYILLPVRQSRKVVLLEDIEYIIADDKICTVKTVHNIYIASLSIHRMEAILPKEHFARIHKRYIVALRFITEIQPQRLYIGSREFPLSRSKRQELESKFIIAD